ncbi:glutathione peroxidase [Natranaerovirga pectinivora]|uniref:Glutathione peroxidase n=1 Tax=Natranaerovirga pectinivora TaxID=682400 RepID=A0A4R3MRG5_9FIRM|nr:glutathione peroxidase [Natranaerovirga pectinivora]TCT15367.1 glutathione peroxidase [Natranaerovirga pectinivora]
MSIYDFTCKNIRGEEVSLENYKGKVLLIANTASKCGLTPQYEGLEYLYKTYQEKGLEILGFPCNQFGNQEPGSNDDIESFCALNYGVSFTIMEKVDVNGDEAHPLFVYLKKEAPGLLSKSIKWNFTKFLIDRNGKVIHRYAPTTSPEKITDDIEKLL